jgi:hypothetical protein
MYLRDSMAGFALSRGSGGRAMCVLAGTCWRAGVVNGVPFIEGGEELDADVTRQRGKGAPRVTCHRAYGQPAV